MINVLLVEDNMGDARLVEEALRQAPGDDFKLFHVVRVREAMHFLRNHRNVDIILSDMTLPDSQGSETFQLLRRAASNVPVIFMTGSADTTLAVEALKKGAQDYLVKGEFSGQFLLRVIRYAIERKKYQEEVSTAKAKTRSLRHEARLLKQEQTQLRALNQAKDEFISLASHQLRTPATGVKQYLGMILEGFAGEVPPALAEFVNKAYESNERQLAIVNDLLKVAQLDAGKVILKPQLTDLAGLLHSIINEQAVKFANRQQALDFQMQADGIRAEIDPERIRMVFENLIDNASKYTPEGRRVAVRLEKVANDVVVSVQDEGVGVAQEHIEKMFHKFTRIANSRSQLVGGSGLGLYWAKRIVDLHNGTITVRSIVGEGTTFTVRLPAAISTDS